MIILLSNTASHYYDLFPYWYNTITLPKLYDTASYYVTTPTIQQFNLLLLIDTTNYYGIILPPIQQSHSTILQSIQQLICSLTHQHWYNNPLQNYISIDSASYYVHTTITILWYLIQQSQLLLYSTNDITILILNNLETTTTYSAI